MSTPVAITADEAGAGAADAQPDAPTPPSWRASDWYYLGFLSMLLFQPVFDPSTTPVSWLVTAGVVAVFVPLYVAAHRRPGRFGRVATPLTAALGFAVFPVNGGATVLFVYAASFAATFLPKRVAVRWFVGLSVAPIVLVLLARLPMPYALPAFAVPAMFVWIVGWAVLEEVDRDRETARLRVDNARIEYLATATERERIARDLHDLLGQSLTEVIVRAQLARRLVDTDRARSVAEVHEIERSARRALDEVRAAVRGWSEVRLDDELDGARRALTAAGVQLIVRRDPAFDPPPTTETALALALRESVTNVVRHAHATRCTVDLQRDGASEVLRVADDGRGGDAADGHGLTGMRARVLAIGGAVDRSGADGTIITVRVPAGLPA